MKTTYYREHPDRLDVVDRKELPDSDFGIPELREFPLPDGAHVRAAESRFHFAPDDKKAALARRILEKAKIFGVDVESEHVLKWAKK